MFKNKETVVSNCLHVVKVGGDKRRTKRRSSEAFNCEARTQRKGFIWFEDHFYRCLLRLHSPAKSKYIYFYWGLHGIIDASEEQHCVLSLLYNLKAKSRLDTTLFLTSLHLEHFPRVHLIQLLYIPGML